ncbi:4-hydroxy-3-methylbut-2-enyl diphosphate reductase [Variovorax sp. GT1P44]|uniref:4-hydroxy-3-methylbut-2-enyl diphosphate reductase n=1 Tax=Variovorax sp. GT1P44 TaxID=3443742 RepID=UPI003F46F76F
MNLWLADPRGFCAGVERAVRMVEELLALSAESVYVRHEIVHNRSVVERLRALGAVFVDEVVQIPAGALAVVSAHGAPPQVFEDARARRLRLFDATCPLVSKVHLEVIAHARAGRTVFLIGHRGHVEVDGTLGHYANPSGGGIQVVQDEQEARRVQARDPREVAYVTQTTLAVDAVQRVVGVLRERFPALRAPHQSDICYATQNRQDAVRMLCRVSELVLVIGAPHSSNSLRMVEVAKEAGVAAHLIECAAEIDPVWLADLENLGLTSGASAPELLVTEAIARVRQCRADVTIRPLGTPEDMVFKLPTALVEMRDRRGATAMLRPPVVPDIIGASPRAGRDQRVMRSKEQR